ncbi:MAG: hypothetical protein IJP03_00265, partial [Christensenellaceae bacterium]|nr:hypothetical protein [Christensenellaceae bacterium]
MFSRFKHRYITYMVVVAVLLLFLIVQLYQLNVKNSQEYAGHLSSSDEKTVYLKGARGSIEDVNGVLLAYDVSSYDVQFYKDPADNASSDRAFYTDVIIKTIDLIEKNGGKTIDTFMIRREENGKFVFNVSSELTEEQRNSRINNWCTNMQISLKNGEDPDPEEIYYELLSRYRIESDTPYEEATKILSIWQEVQLMSYRSYIPITIASNVNFDTVAQIETHAKE